MEILIGGYTKRRATGITELSLTIPADSSQAQLGSAHKIIKIGGPTYFATDADLLFAINNAGKQGGISSFRLIDGVYQEQASYLQAGSSPAYIGINKSQKLLYTANYHTSELAVFTYTATGKFKLLTSITHTADTLGPRPEQTDGPHPHFFEQTPAGNLVSCDLGNDCLDFYRLENNKLNHLARYQNEPGFGSRHLTFSPDGKYFYVVGELASKVNVVKIDETNWTFTNLATYSTIPQDFTAHNGAAAIRMSADGHYLYVSNRGHDSLVVFAIKPNHTLELRQRIATFGEFPRDFNWDRTQKYVVAANQNTDNLTLYTRNAENGCLTPIQKDVAVPEGTCVLFQE